jgi:hypothetical protein
MAKSRTQTYYDKNPEANQKRLVQQGKYNKTGKGTELRVRANALRAKLKIAKGDPRDAGHYKGSKTNGRPQSRKTNRARKPA